jgi:hypothetical protein
VRPRRLVTPLNWCRIVRRPDLAFEFHIGAKGERDAFRAFLYPHEQVPTVNDALELAAALAAAPPILAAVSVPVTLAEALAVHLPAGIADRVRHYPTARLAYQLPVSDREAIRALLRVAERRIGAHVDPFEEAEAVNLAARLHRALGAV